MQPDPNAVAVARRVREVLEQAGVSAAEVARRNEWTQSYIARRMTGEVPFSAADLISVSIAANVPLRSLLPDTPTLTTDASVR